MSRRKTTEEFIEKAKIKHNGKYDYSKTKYIKAHEKVCIVCPSHGEFWQTPHEHLKGYGCQKCGGNYRWKTNEWINEAQKQNGNHYLYNKTKYVNKVTKVIVTCPIHGDFKIFPYDHLSGHGCPKCVGKYHYTTEEWIEKAKQTHNNKFDYSKVQYANCMAKVCIICPKHGEFWQNANHHLSGVGCPTCGNASKLEEQTAKVLELNNIEYERQKKFEWLGMQRLDFYVPRYNFAIECQGIQHFQEVKHFGGINGYIERRERDKKKQQLCLDNALALYYINYNENVNVKIKEILKKSNL